MNKRTKVMVVGFSVVGVALIIFAVLALQPKPSKTSASTKSTDQGTKKMDTNPSNVQSTDEVVGTGAEAKVDSTITVKYSGSLADGTVFDSTDKHGGTPATFQLSQGKLIDGWVQGIPGMKVGGKRKLVIPPELAYGVNGTQGIPPNSTLTFEIELLDVK